MMWEIVQVEVKPKDNGSRPQITVIEAKEMKKKKKTKKTKKT